MKEEKNGGNAEEKRQNEEVIIVQNVETFSQICPLLLLERRE